MTRSYRDIQAQGQSELDAQVPMTPKAREAAAYNARVRRSTERVQDAYDKCASRCPELPTALAAGCYLTLTWLLGRGPTPNEVRARFQRTYPEAWAEAQAGRRTSLEDRMADMQAARDGYNPGR